MNTLVACPRHGVVSVAADAPCPHCGVAAYDLGSRQARDVVRSVRELCLKKRTFVVGAVLAVTTVVRGDGFVLGHSAVSVNLVPWLAAGLLAGYLARPIARLLERDRALRALDAALAGYRD
jgi:hypothetical protein